MKNRICFSSQEIEDIASELDRMSKLNLFFKMKKDGVDKHLGKRYISFEAKFHKPYEFLTDGKAYDISRQVLIKNFLRNDLHVFTLYDDKSIISDVSSYEPLIPVHGLWFQCKFGKLLLMYINGFQEVFFLDKG